MPPPAAIGEQEPVAGLPHLVGDMQRGGLGQLGTHPPGPLDMNFRPALNGLAVQAKSTTNRLRVPGPLVAGGKIGAAGRPCVPLHRATQPKHCIPMLLDPPAHHHITGEVQLQCDDRHLLRAAPIRRLRLPPPPRRRDSSYRRIRQRGSLHAPILS
jgi:hypothetical protein